MAEVTFSKEGGKYICDMCGADVVSTDRGNHAVNCPKKPPAETDKTVAELQDDLRSQGKPTSGTKDELLERLGE